MDRMIVMSSRSKQSIFITNKVLRNTYFLLSMTLAFSAFIAILSTVFNFPKPGFLITLIGFYGLMFLTYRFANRSIGILYTFAFTGFMGYTLGPLFSLLLSSGSGEMIVLALGGTALVFLFCSIYVLMTRKDMSFLSGMMMAGLIVLLISIIANVFLHIPTLALAISVLFILFSSGAILLETSNILHGGETNYIRATVSLYVALYNIFVSLISINGIRNN